MVENPVVAGLEGPPCGDCIHQVVCGLRTAYQTFIRARLPIGGDLPAGLSWRIAVDCEHFIGLAVVPPYERPYSGASGGAVRVDVRAIEDEGSGDWLADSVRNREREQTEEPDDADAFTEPAGGLNGGVVETAADHAFPILAAEDGSAQPPPPSGSEYAPPITGRQQNEIALAHDSRDDPRPRSAPIGEALVTCEPGCGQQFAQAAIGAHRRTCVAVMEFKAARGVTVVPGLSGAAPLPDPVASDFDQKRVAHAKEAAERTWRQNHVAAEVVDRAAAAKKEVERVSRKPTTPIPPLVAPAVAAPPGGAKLNGQRRGPNGLTPRHEEVLEAIRTHGGVNAAARAKGWTGGLVSGAVSVIRSRGLLPADIAELLAANRTNNKTVAS